jgi:Na+-translocating ferredoxin:NAD+ oxidoreductase RNF subunit RnfB
MDFGTLLISMGSMGGLGALFSTGLSIANKKLQVDEDPKVVALKEELPGANCGGCGYPGCGAFAEAVAAGEAELTDCSVASMDAIEEMANILGVEVSATENLIARVMCQGGNYETAKKAEYEGIESCLAVKMLGGGEKLCEYGCLGYGECVDACPFDAIYMGDNGLPIVIEDKCTGCGNCVDACVRDVIELHPQSEKLFVLCKNHDSPKESRQLCTKACIGCQICVRAAGDDNMYMDNNLARVNYDQYGKDANLPTDKCPTDCLVILNAEEADAQEDQDLAA